MSQNQHKYTSNPNKAEQVEQQHKVKVKVSDTAVKWLIENWWSRYQRWYWLRYQRSNNGNLSTTQLFKDVKNLANHNDNDKTEEWEWKKSKCI